METPSATEPRTGDGELVRQACAGRRAAFDELIERHQRRATAVAYRLLGNLHDALEVCQEAFVRAHGKLGTLDDPQRFGPWLLRIVTNLSLNFRRSRGTAGRHVSFEDCLREDEGRSDEIIADRSAHEQRPDSRLAAAELAARVQAAIADLPATQRTALVLFSIEQLPQKEVAEIMGSSVEAVKWHVFQARRRLKERLAEFL